MLVGSWKLGGEEVLGKENYVRKETPILLPIFEEDKTHVSQAWFALGCQLFFLFCKFLATLSIIRKVPEESKTLNQLETHCCQGSRSIWVSSSMMILYLVHP
jgi:hypothetical protein